MKRTSLFRSKTVRSTSATSRRARRAQHRGAAGLLEPLEIRQLLTAVVTTDQQDYAPGSTAYIAARDFQPGEALELQVLRTDGVADGPPGNVPWYVQDGDNTFT